MVGLHARYLVEGEIPTFFSTSWYSIPQLFYAFPAMSLTVFGDSLFGLRMGTVILGTISVIPFFFLIRYWWGEKAAILAALLLITNHWFLHLMHCGVNYVQALFFAILLLALWAYANSNRTWEIHSLCGLTMGLSLMSYQANHILPILWVASQIHLVIFRQLSIRQFVVSLCLPIGVALLILSPLLAHDFAVAGKTEIFSARSSSVAIWTDNNSKHVDSVYEANGDTSRVWREQFKRAFLSTILYSDRSIQYNGQAPFLDFLTSVLFCIGIVISLYRFFDPRWFIPTLWISSILLIGGVFTVDAPFYPRLAGLGALLFIPIAGVISHTLEAKHTLLRALTFLVAIVIVVGAAGLNLNHYFNEFAKNISPQSVHYPQTQMAYDILSRPTNERIFVFGGTHFAFNSGTVNFLVKDRKGFDVERVPVRYLHTQLAIYVDPSKYRELTTLQEQFPDHTMTAQKNPFGRTMYYSFTKDNSK
jgi:4-amino-4-deoxy-L-arabinose transferase-like glycosyltransferase